MLLTEMQEPRPLLLIIRQNISVPVLLARRVLGDKIRSRIDIAFAMMIDRPCQVRKRFFLAACVLLGTDLIFGLTVE